MKGFLGLLLCSFSAFVQEIGGALIARNLPAGTQKVWLADFSPLFLDSSTSELREFVKGAFNDSSEGVVLPLGRVARFTENSADFEPYRCGAESRNDCYMVITANDTDLDAATFTSVEARFREFDKRVLCYVRVGRVICEVFVLCLMYTSL